MGGVIIGYELGKILNKRTIFSERVNNEFRLRRDFKIKKGDKVLIVEDVITTGKSSMECSKLVSLNNASIIGYACIIDRSNGKSEIKGKIVSQVELNIPIYSKDNLPNYYQYKQLNLEVEIFNEKLVGVKLPFATVNARGKHQVH